MLLPDVGFGSHISKTGMRSGGKLWASVWALDPADVEDLGRSRGSSIAT
jgi:hypothetical protein